MLLFLDIQTTGYEQSDKICSLGLLGFDDVSCVRVLYSLVNEGKKIPAVASALHNITNEMIVDKPSVMQSEVGFFLEKHNNEENTLVMHNATVVMAMLRAVGFTWHGKIMDTYKVTKHLIRECEIFSLEFLRYELRLYRQEKKLQTMCGIKDALVAHHARSNALFVRLLYEYLLDMTTMESMVELSFKKVLLEKFSFGKYVGRYIEEIVQNDRNYVMWMLTLENLDDDLKYSIEYYLQG